MSYQRHTTNYEVNNNTSSTSLFMKRHMFGIYIYVHSLNMERTGV